MDRYTDEAEAQAEGFRIDHEPDRNRFVLLQVARGALEGVEADPGANGASDGNRESASDGGKAETNSKVVGEAHYSLIGEHGIDFDHTVVDTSLRGTGLSGLLAKRALTDEVVRGRKVQASCWYIEGYLERHPHLLEAGN